MLAEITGCNPRWEPTRDVDGQNCHEGPRQCGMDKGRQSNGQIHQQALARDSQRVEHEKGVISAPALDFHPSTIPLPNLGTESKYLPQPEQPLWSLQSRQLQRKEPISNTLCNSPRTQAPNKPPVPELHLSSTTQYTVFRTNSLRRKHMHNTPHNHDPARDLHRRSDDRSTHESEQRVQNFKERERLRRAEEWEESVVYARDASLRAQRGEKET